jgi:hypothetical protein
MLVSELITRIVDQYSIMEVVMIRGMFLVRKVFYRYYENGISSLYYFF